MTKSKSARDLYQSEKARRARTALPDSELMAEAPREYAAMIEAQATKGKGGRPKKKVAKPVDDEVIEDEIEVEVDVDDLDDAVDEAPKK